MRPSPVGGGGGKRLGEGWWPTAARDPTSVGILRTRPLVYYNIPFHPQDVSCAQTLCLVVYFENIANPLKS